MVSILNKLRAHKNIPKNNEHGNSLVLYLLMFPVVFSFFGLAIDTTVATYTQTSLQSNLDAAVQSTLSRAINPGGAGNLATQPTLPEATAKQYMISIYDTNRIGNNEQPFVICQNSLASDPDSPAPGARMITPPSGCSWTERGFTYRVSNGELYISASIIETSKPVFLQFLNIDHFTYNISSEARTSYARR